MSKYKKSFDKIITCRVRNCSRIFEPDKDNPRSAGSAFSAHLQYEHKIKAIDYTIAFIHNGKQPTCEVEECNNTTRYVSYTFKRFCKEHSKYAMKKGGQEGGKFSAWNKGLTKESDERIAIIAKNMSGSNNPFFGKQHSFETRQRISNTCKITSKIFDNRLFLREQEWKCLTPYSEYTNRQKQYLEFECLKCKEKSMMTLFTFERGSLCNNCYCYQVSIAQKEIADWIRTKTNKRVELSTKRIITQGFKSLLSYADLRFGSGLGYIKAGFKYVDLTGIGFCWTDLKYCYPRQRCKADSKNNITEKEAASNLNWSKLWLPGHNIYVKNLS